MSDITREEAIKILKDTLYDERTPNNYIQAVRMGREALENQKTMQVELEGDGYSDGKLVYDFGRCPKCGWEFEEGDKDWEEPYCCHCGQRLHWFD